MTGSQFFYRIMKMKKIITVFMTMAVILILLHSCSAGKERIKIAGSTTVLPIVQAAAESYMEMHPEINISIRGGGSSIGIRSILGKVIDIGNASRKVQQNEEKLLSADEDLVETAIALDALSVIVNSENGIDSISSAQLKEIYTGKLTNWSQLNGKDQEIVIISRDTPSGSFEVFKQNILEDEKVISSATLLPSNNAVATTVGNTPGAIGYVGLGFTASTKLKPLFLDKVYPSKESAQNGSYKLTRPLLMYTLKSADENTEKFIDFILSPAGQLIVEQQGYIGIRS
jgi:phosphate transport system substrate-binding protein